MDKNSKEYYLELARHCGICKNDLIYPIFITESNQHKSLVSMPGIAKIPYHKIINHVDNLMKKDLRTLILFGDPKKRDEKGSLSFSHNGIIQKTLKLLKTTFGDKLSLISDVCLCQYNKSGHCGILDTKNNQIKNDETLEYLCKIALSHSEAGADIVAPSSMMDGQVKIIREKLNNEGYKKIKILSFSAKLSSSLYKPFRMETFLRKNLKNLDKSSYQVSYCNRKEIIREIDSDIREGADMVMIKPSITSLDLIYQTSKICKLPIVVQIVSGEYSMIKAASSIGAIDEIYYLINLIGAIKRAGGNKIISYSSLDLSRFIGR